MPATYVKCTHTKANRMQECILVFAVGRIACIPIGPSQNAVGKIAVGLAMTAVGVVEVRCGSLVIDARMLETADMLDAAVTGSGGFYLDAAWTYRTRVPVIGTMLMHGVEAITTRGTIPDGALAKLTPNRAPPSARAVKVVCAIAGVILAAATITFLATGSYELLFGIGFWGVLMIGAAVFAWVRIKQTA